MHDQEAAEVARDGAGGGAGVCVTRAAGRYAGRGRAASLVLGGALALCPLSSAAAPAGESGPLLQAAARSRVGADQGVLAVAEDGTVLASLHPDRAVHPASVTKVATTLALFRELGPEHRFETGFQASGPVHDGVLDGDLLVEAGGDPFFVYEDAFLVLLELRRTGVRDVTGRVRVRGPLVFNWRLDDSERRLQLALAGRDGREAWTAVQGARAGAEPVPFEQAGLHFAGRDGAARHGAATPLVIHESPPLRRIVKELNGYSNNVFHVLSDRIGGPAAVQRLVRGSVAADLGPQIVITNAAGAGTTNRLSPRAAVAVVRALAEELRSHRMDLRDVLPVAGIDRGTLEDRFRAPGMRGAVVAKTGTYGSLGVSSLAGVVHTQRFGTVAFAILNRGLTVLEARRRQDAFIEALCEVAGAQPMVSYRPPSDPPFASALVRGVR
jgi:D-alanyl-D-alanine carboxypeptidase/D-alanyl-D-alanine-endopeptidase (penicillin-binding protein 4)